MAEPPGTWETPVLETLRMEHLGSVTMVATSCTEPPNHSLARVAGRGGQAGGLAWGAELFSSKCTWAGTVHSLHSRRYINICRVNKGAVGKTGRQISTRGRTPLDGHHSRVLGTGGADSAVMGPVTEAQGPDLERGLN